MLKAKKAASQQAHAASRSADEPWRSSGITAQRSRHDRSSDLSRQTTPPIRNSTNGRFSSTSNRLDSNRLRYGKWPTSIRSSASEWRLIRIAETSSFGAIPETCSIPFCGFKAGRENSCRLASAQFVAVFNPVHRGSRARQIISHLLDSLPTLIREATLWVFGFAFARSVLNQVNAHRHFLLSVSCG